MPHGGRREAVDAPGDREAVGGWPSPGRLVAGSAARRKP